MDTLTQNAHAIDSLDAILKPRSIAVIGASRTRGTVSAEIFRNILRHGFTGVVYPVNAVAKAVHSVRAYPSVEALPETPDLAVVVVPAAHVVEVAEACARRGVRALVVVSAGFKETGATGRAREQALAEIAHRSGMRLVGPNCLGVVNTDPDVRLDATFAPTFPPAGPVGFLSQSGGLGLAILEHAAALGIGVSQFVSVGNKADVSGNDLLEYWERDPHTRVVLLYLESFGNPRRFTQIARRVARHKPIIAVKSGRTRAGSRAATSHTGSLAGADTAADALFLQSGVIRTDTMEEMFDVAMLLAHQPAPAGRRVGIITNAGGPGIMATDACVSHGLKITTLTDATTDALRALLPAEASVGNPVDMIASASPEVYEEATRLLFADANVDAVMVVFVPPIVTRSQDVAHAIVRVAEEARAAGNTKPVVSCFLGRHGVTEGLRSLHEGHIPSYAFPESAAIALARAARYGAWRAEPEGRVLRYTDVSPTAANDALSDARRRGARLLDPLETARLLSAYNIAMPSMRIVHSAREAEAVAHALEFPVVAKLVSPTITHKSDVGGVIVDIESPQAAAAAFDAIVARLREKNRDGDMSGVLLQEMVPGGIETIVGATADPVFGPVIMFGMGGVYVELLRDVAFRVHPLTDRDARELVRSVRGARLFDGFRGAPPGDVAALEQVILRLSQLVGDHPEITEIDINPLVVLPPGDGCIALDARVAIVTEEGQMELAKGIEPPTY